MSNPTFDRVETTLKDLKQIVDISHAQSTETARLVEDIALLIEEIKNKASDSGLSIVMAPSSAIPV